MKKTTLIITLFILSKIFVFGQIVGSPTIPVGVSETYCLYGYPDMIIKWEAMGGNFIVAGGSHGCATVTGTKAGVGTLRATVINPINSLPVAVEYESIQIMANPKSPVIQGPAVLRPNQVAQYKVSDTENRMIVFTAPSSYFDIISTAPTSITVRAKDNLGTTFIKAKASDIDGNVDGYRVVSISNPNYTITTTASSPFCNNCNITYKLNNTLEGDVITWEAVSNVSLVSGQGTANAVFRTNANSNGIATIRARVNSSGYQDVIENNSIWVGKPVISRIDGERFGTPGQYSDYRAVYNDLSMPTSFQWVLTPQGRNSIYPNYSSCTLSLREEGIYVLKVRATNANGTGEYFDTYVEVYDLGIYSYMVYPSPASDVLMVNFDVKLPENSGSEMMKNNQDIFFKIYLYNENGVMARQTTSDGSQIQFDVSNLPNGMYYLHIYNGRADKPEVRKVIVKH